MPTLRRLFFACAAATGCGALSGLDALVETGRAADAGREDGALPEDATGADGFVAPEAAVYDAAPSRPDVEVPDGKALLYVVVLGAPGRVTTDPAEGNIDCTNAGGPRCWALFDKGTVTSLFAEEEDGGARFAEWGGACTASVAPSCALTMNSSEDVSARYE
jgi:hypothetical protein